MLDFACVNPKKPQNEKARNAGISLEPDLIAQSDKHAKTKGHRGISALVRYLLVNELKRSGESAKKAAEKIKADSSTDLAKAADAVKASKRKKK